MKILIAEDEAVSRKLLSSTLAQWGYEVVAAKNGQEAWDILQQEGAPRLAILDWMMPELDGVEVTQRLRKDESLPYTYVILLTSKNEKKDIIEGLASGADDYLAKPFDANELKLRIRVGRRIMQLLEELQKAREILTRKAAHDSLTTLYNRGAILEILEREVARSQREHSNLGLIMLDLDYFKKINDTYGHMAGDSVLRETSKRLLNGIRPYDYVGRYGGEEFLIILPGCNFINTRARAEQLLSDFRTKKMNIPEAVLEVTASFGFISTDLLEQYNAEQLIQMADQALYEAKEMGRNRIVSPRFFSKFKNGQTFLANLPS